MYAESWEETYEAITSGIHDYSIMHINAGCPNEISLHRQLETVMLARAAIMLGCKKYRVYGHHARHI